MLGHADVGITLSVYAHVLPDMQDEAARAMDSFSALKSAELLMSESEYSERDGKHSRGARVPRRSQDTSGGSSRAAGSFASVNPMMRLPQSSRLAIQ
jgi:hypothetical protein